MNSVVGEYIDDFVLIYLDDILVFSSTEHEHENHLRLVFPAIERAQAPKPNLRSMSLVNHYVKYLGYIVGSGEVHVDKDKVAAVANWEPPRDIKGI